MFFLREVESLHHLNFGWQIFGFQEKHLIQWSKVMHRLPASVWNVGRCFFCWEKKWVPGKSADDLSGMVHGLSGMVHDLVEWLSDLQLGDQKVRN